MLSGLPVNSSHSHLVTRSCRHTVNSSPVNSSQTRLITQSTRHKRAHDKTTSTSRNYLHAVGRYPETVLNTDGVITAICVTLMYTADSRSRRHITLLRKARSTRHNAVKHDGQLVTRFYDVTSWPCDELTGSRCRRRRRPSVVSLSVTLVHCTGATYSDGWNFRQCFYAIWYLGHPFGGQAPPGPSGEAITLPRPGSSY